MSDSKRIFEVGQTVFIIDYWGTGNGEAQAFETQAEIRYVNQEKQILGAVLYGDTYQIYSFNDYGRLIFDTLDEAKENTNKLPKPNSVVFEKIGNQVCEQIVLGITGEKINGTYDLMVRLKNGKNVSIKEIGISIFLTK